jgi:large subunit ribosomal protein L24
VSVARIKKNDVVVVRSGKDAGKTGKVLFADLTAGRAIVEGLNLVKKTMRKSQDNPQGGIVDKEAPLAAAKLMLHCPECKKGVRIRRLREGDKPVRKCKECGHSFES